MLTTTPGSTSHHHHHHASNSIPASATNMTTAQKQVKWAPGLGQPSDIHVALVDPDMAWDDARLARILRTDHYLSMTVSPQLPRLVRSYNCFADLHSQLLLAHPHESGRTGKMPRSLPFLPDWPAQLDRNTSHRLVRGLGTYLQELAALPAHILHHESVAKFCEPPPVPPVPQQQQPAQLFAPSAPPTSGDQMATNGRAWSTMSNASNSDPSLPRGRHPGAPPQQPPPRVTSTASSGVSLNIPKHMSGGLGDSSSAPVSPVDGSFHQQRNQRGTVFPRGSSLPPSPSSSHFPEYPPLPPAPDQRSPAVPSRSSSPRFAPRSASQSRDPADFGAPPQRIRSSREQSMAGSSLSHTSSGSSHSRPPMPPPSTRQPSQQHQLHHHSSAPEVLSSPHLPPRGVSSNGDHSAPPPRRSASSTLPASSSRLPSALPPSASPRFGTSGGSSPALPPLPDPSTPSVATPSSSLAGAGAAAGHDFGDKSLKIKLVFPKLQHIAAVRIRLDALSMGTLLTAVESKVDQAHTEWPEVQRPHQYTICYRVPEGQEGGGKSVKVNQQTWPGIVREVVGRGEEKVVLYMLY